MECHADEQGEEHDRRAIMFREEGRGSGDEHGDANARRKTSECGQVDHGNDPVEA
jgi:hypothetical protein